MPRQMLILWVVLCKSWALSRELLDIYQYFFMANDFSSAHDIHRCVTFSLPLLVNIYLSHHFCLSRNGTEPVVKSDPTSLVKVCAFYSSKSANDWNRGIHSLVQLAGLCAGGLHLPFSPRTLAAYLADRAGRSLRRISSTLRSGFNQGWWYPSNRSSFQPQVQSTSRVPDFCSCPSYPC